MCFEPLGLRATLEREAAEPEFCVRGESKQTPEKTFRRPSGRTGLSGLRGQIG